MPMTKSVNLEPNWVIALLMAAISLLIVCSPAEPQRPSSNLVFVLTAAAKAEVG